MRVPPSSAAALLLAVGLLVGCSSQPGTESSAPAAPAGPTVVIDVPGMT